MEHKNIVATIYLKDGLAVKSPSEHDNGQDPIKLAEMYNDSGIDKIFLVDLSDDDEEHEKNILVMRDINRSIDVKTCGGGNIKRLEDVKKILYAGCIEVVMNGSKPETPEILSEAAERFGPEKMLVSIKNVDFVFKQRSLIKDSVHELVIMEPSVAAGIPRMSSVPYILKQDENDIDLLFEKLSNENIRGIYGSFINDPNTDIMNLKAQLSHRGIKMDNFEPRLKWSDLKANDKGLVPVVVQDYRTNQVLMLAYMNEEAFEKTITIGRMTYFSRSRNELWTKGETSGHFQYVKSLTADCDFDTILAKVSQVGVACHTGEMSCFFNEIVKKEYVEKDPLKVFDNVYKIIEDRKIHPKEGSYTNYLFNKGLDKILKKVGEEASEVIIASKNAVKDDIVYEEADLLYHLMVLMVEKGVTWEDVTRELAQR
ncbi:MAG: bifunctional phosphoribosyl-AMP cyclohydrolase/phosphoribosyl-ATP diphosphatase HisIE [Lachnospiraceae bacterium]|nr:bifunctional phosphoribosyl-AMP cyclohydrolase/phosphoribosyl-ATP diphosphatase HisIE [Lachnospiraceae bacterium]